MFPTWPDSVTKKYRHVPLECLARVKALAKRHENIYVHSVPMPGSRDRFRVSIKASGHSWVASSELMAEFWNRLTDDDRITLSCLLDLGGI